MFLISRNSDLDLDVCKFVFGLDPDSFRWGVPFFSVDRNAAAIVNTEMAFRKDESREKYEKELERRAIELGWKSKPECGGVSMFLCLILPEEICKAAIVACQTNDDTASPSSIDKGLHQCQRTDLNNSAGHRSKTT